MDPQWTASVPSSVTGSQQVLPAKVALLSQLAERFLPYVDAVLRPRAKKGIAALMGLITERSPEIRELLGALEDGSAVRGRVRAFAACGVGLFPRTLGTLKKKVEWTVTDTVEASAFTLVLGWLDTFPRAGQATLILDADSLDDAMLPRLDKAREQRFAECCDRISVSVTEARGILRAVRTALPIGYVIPDEAAQLLDAELIIIVR